jgi:hypothetical protein
MPEVLLVMSIQRRSQQRGLSVLYEYVTMKQIPVAARSKAWICGRTLAGIISSKPAGACRSVCFESCVLSVRGLCVGRITGPEEFFQVWVV